MLLPRWPVLGSGYGGDIIALLNIFINLQEPLVLTVVHSVGEILRLNPGYKVPENYKPVLKETIIPLPVC